MHYKKVKGILSSSNGMNLYRGCIHGCIYCDSRSKCYQMDHEFRDVEIKENALELLEMSLRRKRNKCMIGMGSMSDPYIPIEKEIQHTRKALEIVYKYGFGITLITKSDLIVRDLDLLTKINEKSKCVIQMTLTTYRDSLCKIIEPNVCTTQERIKVLHHLKECNIPAVVWLCPILPFINDTKENLIQILEACKKANVYGIICFGMGLTLREGNREYFYKQLDRSFPGLKEKYIKYYGNSYSVLSFRNKELMHIFHSFCEKNGIVHDNNQIFEYLNTFEEKHKIIQETLF